MQPVTIPTEREDVSLRQLVLSDSESLFSLIERNRDHLSQFDDTTSAKYPDLASVQKSIEAPQRADRLRFGVWRGQDLLGVIQLTPFPAAIFEIGYWIGSEFAGQRIAVCSTRALCDYAFAFLDGREVVASVHVCNTRSQAVLISAGFRCGHRISNSPQVEFALSAPR